MDQFEEHMQSEIAAEYADSHDEWDEEEDTDRRSWDVYRELKTEVENDRLTNLSPYAHELFYELGEYMDIDEGSDIGADMGILPFLFASAVVFTAGLLIGILI